MRPPEDPTSSPGGPPDSGDSTPSVDPDRTAAGSGYDRRALAAAYGDVDPDVFTFEVRREKYERLRADARADAIGGARALVGRGRERPRDDDRDRSRGRSRSEAETLLVSNRGEPGWDVPGGAREPGESPEETARREVREEVGLAVRLLELLGVNEFGFVPETGDGDRVAGLWVYFAAVPVDPEATLDVRTEELHDAAWVSEPPDELDPHAAPLVREFFDGEG